MSLGLLAKDLAAAAGEAEAQTTRVDHCQTRGEQEVPVRDWDEW